MKFEMAKTISNMLTNTFSEISVDTLLAEPDTLAILGYGSGNAVQIVSTQLNNLDDAQQNHLEVWKFLGGEIEEGADGSCQWRRSSTFQFVSIIVPCSTDDDYEKATEAAYREILATIQNSAYPKVMRFWNLIPHINRGDGERENYKKFCTGRLTAFSQFNVADSKFPAASCVGHYNNGIVVYALTSVFEPTHIGNPRQVNAYSYPKQYGRSSPSFARATSVAAGETELCFVSGTASVLGHNTVHQGDLVGQLHTTNDNILYLLKEAGRTTDEVRSLRVFIRHPEHFDQIKKMVEHWYPKACILYTHADICRADLLVEIECFCCSGSSDNS